MFTIQPSSITCFQFPDDADVGKQMLLSKFADPSETWVRAYAFTFEPLLEDIEAAAKKGTIYHIFADHSEDVGTEKPLMQQLADVLKDTKCDLTIGTSQAGKQYIMHQKGFVTANNDCWEGSLNFSATGWLQVNSAMQFNNKLWTTKFQESFAVDLAYARANEASYQVLPMPSA